MALDASFIRSKELRVTEGVSLASPPMMSALVRRVLRVLALLPVGGAIACGPSTSPNACPSGALSSPTPQPCSSVDALCVTGDGYWSGPDDGGLACVGNPVLARCTQVGDASATWRVELRQGYCTSGPLAPPELDA